jgi:hypothetical protein
VLDPEPLLVALELALDFVADDEDWDEEAEPLSPPPPSAGGTKNVQVKFEQVAPRLLHLQSVETVHQPGFAALGAAQTIPVT